MTQEDIYKLEVGKYFLVAFNDRHEYRAIVEVVNVDHKDRFFNFKYVTTDNEFGDASGSFTASFTMNIIIIMDMGYINDLAIANNKSKEEYFMEYCTEYFI